MPMEAIFVSQKTGPLNPLIVVIHGGPHSVSLTSFSKSLAFLASLGFNLLIVNYRLVLKFLSGILRLSQCLSSYLSVIVLILS